MHTRTLGTYLLTTSTVCCWLAGATSDATGDIFYVNTKWVKCWKSSLVVFSLLLLHHSESKKALKDIHAFSCILIELCVYVTTSNRRRSLGLVQVSGVGREWSDHTIHFEWQCSTEDRRSVYEFRKVQLIGKYFLTNSTPSLVDSWDVIKANVVSAWMRIWVSCISVSTVQSRIRTFYNTSNDNGGTNYTAESGHLMNCPVPKLLLSAHH